VAVALKKKWLTPSDCGLFSQPEYQAPVWMTQLLLIEPPLEWPPKVNQRIFDREIEHIMRTGFGTPVVYLRVQPPASQYTKERRDQMRADLFAKQGGKCHWCQKPMTMHNPTGRPTGAFASFEHLLPRSLGGRFTADNIVLAHKTCNHHRESYRHKLARYAHDPMREGGMWNVSLRREADSHLLDGEHDRVSGQSQAIRGGEDPGAVSDIG
jgi:hypothetical protein